MSGGQCRSVACASPVTRESSKPAVLIQDTVLTVTIPAADLAEQAAKSQLSMHVGYDKHSVLSANSTVHKFANIS